jgi:hypothetical protein
MRRVHALLTAGFLVVLGACGAGEGADTTAAPDDVGADDAAITTTTEPATEEELSLASFLPFYGPEDPEEQEEYWRNQEIRAQEYVRDCMAEEGFEYIPYVPSFDYDYEDWEATEEERRAEQGFGMAFWLLEGDEYEEQFEEEWDETDDPNFAIMEAMSDSEREAYEYALFGEQPDMELDWEGAETEEEMLALEEEAERLWREREWKGCMELGWEETTGGDAVWMSFEEEFGNMWEDVWERTQADPRVVKLDQDWAACMSETGYEFRDQDDMYMTLHEEFEQLVTWPGDEGGSSTVTTVPAPEVEPVEQEDGTVIFVDPEGNEYTEDQMNEFWQPQYDEAALRTFMEKEIAIAVAEYSCSEGYWEAVDEVRKDYEAQWVGENLAALEAWKAGLEADG